MRSQYMSRMNGVRGHWTSGAPRAPGRGRTVTVYQWERTLLFRHGVLVATLEPGRHRRWGSGYTARVVDIRPAVLQVPTQEVPTADGVTVKVTVAGQVTVTDPVAYVTATQDVYAALYLAVQVALRQLVSQVSVEEMLAGREELGVRLTEGVRGLENLGVALERLELKDVILPADLKRAQGEVLIARAQGLASLERARGETAALRNLANAARMCADNPVLLQLRLLEQLSSGPSHTVVFGNPPLGAGPST